MFICVADDCASIAIRWTRYYTVADDGKRSNAEQTNVFQTFFIRPMRSTLQHTLKATTRNYDHGKYRRDQCHLTVRRLNEPDLRQGHMHQRMAVKFLLSFMWVRFVHHQYI